MPSPIQYVSTDGRTYAGKAAKAAKRRDARRRAHVASNGTAPGSMKQ